LTVENVLVFTPVYRLEAETVKAIMDQDWGGSVSVLIQRDNPVAGDDRATGVANHLHQYQRGRDLFLRGDWDAMLTIESDMTPPPDALTRLVALDADVAYGCYMFRTNGGEIVNVCERYTPHSAPQQARNMGEPLNLRGLWSAAVRAGVVECSGAGFGCTLIKREVLDAVPFEPCRNPAAFFDRQWTEQVYRAGYSMLADTGVKCGHIDTTGEVYHVA